MKRPFYLFFFPLALTAGTPNADRIGSFDNWFAKDKAQHAVISFIATGFSVYKLRHEAGQRADDARWGGTLVTVTLGLGKEFKDRARPGNHFCFKDLVADGIGIAAALLVTGSW